MRKLSLSVPGTQIPCSWNLLRVALGVSFIIALYFFISFHQDSSSSSSNGIVVEVPLEYIMTGDAVELPQDDFRIKTYILSNGFLVEPSELPYNLTDPQIDPSKGQGQMVRKILKNMRDGFFVECGGLDGETRSNTLYLEKQLGWKGLLIEADPQNFQILKTKHRKSWSSNSCLATKSIPHQVVFRQDFNMGKIETSSIKDSFNKSISKHFVKVQCFPLFSLLNALGVTKVDYFSLDVEGNELEVLQNIPFDKVFIKVLSVEYVHVAKGKSQVKDFMMSKGYILAATVTFKNNLANDYIFVHQTLRDSLHHDIVL